MRNPLGYKTLRTYQQGIEIHELTKIFTSTYLDSYKDKRLIAHMDDSGRSIPRNIAEGYGRTDTKQYYQFLGFSLGSLLELLEDCLALEKEIKGRLRATKGNNGEALKDLDKLIKLCMGEKTMLIRQMEALEKSVGEQGLWSQKQKITKAKEIADRKEQEFERWLEKTLGSKKLENGQWVKDDEGEIKGD